LDLSSILALWMRQAAQKLYKTSLANRLGSRIRG
jgi:hypothetical protein